jgi:hypothetical protein
LTEPEHEPETENSERLKGPLPKPMSFAFIAESLLQTVDEGVATFEALARGFDSEQSTAVLEASAKAAVAGLDEEDE